MKPLITYYGGKQYLSKEILKYFPSHRVYVEPFCGGAALFFTKSPSRIEVLNDKSDLLINMYRVAIKYPKEFQLEINATLYSQSDHERVRLICKNPNDYTDLEKAWAYFINISFAFSSKLNNVWSVSNLRRKPNELKNKKLILPKILERLENAYISREDAIKCIKKWDSVDTFFYCDPPYPGADQGHYNGYTLDDYKLLVETLDNIKGSYILSNYHQDIYPKSATKKVEINTLCHAKKTHKDKGETREKRTEIIWIKANNGINQQLQLFSA